MKGKFKYQNYSLRLVFCVPFLVVTLILMIIFVMPMMDSETYFTLLELVVVLVEFFVYIKVTRSISFFVKEGDWHIDNNTLTVTKGRRKYLIDLKSIREVFLAPKDFFFEYSTITIRDDMTNVKIKSTYFKGKFKYSQDQLKMFNAIKAKVPRKYQRSNYWLRRS